VEMGCEHSQPILAVYLGARFERNGCHLRGVENSLILDVQLIVHTNAGDCTAHQKALQ